MPSGVIDAVERGGQLVGRPGAPRRVLRRLQPLDGVADHGVGEQVGRLVPAVHARHLVVGPSRGAHAQVGGCNGGRRGAVAGARGRTSRPRRSRAAEALPHQLDGVALGRAEPGVQLRVDLPLHHRHRGRRRRRWPGRGRSSAAAVSTSSAGRARLTRPMRAASSPLTLRAVYSRSRAWAGRRAGSAATTGPTRRPGRAGRTTS